MNRKGDIPTILLFGVTLALGLIALFSFASFKGDFESESKDISLMLEEVIFYQEYLEQVVRVVGKQVTTEENGKERFRELVLERKTDLGGLGEFFDRIEKGDFEFDGSEFVMFEVFVQSEINDNVYRKSFDLKIDFG